MVLELVHGMRIDHWCETGAPSVRQRIELFIQCSTAAAAHTAISSSTATSNPRTSWSIGMGA